MSTLLIFNCVSPPDTPFQGTLRVVDKERGATLRSNWSIDDSEELGSLPYETTLRFDAVSTLLWLLPEKCNNTNGL